MLKSYLAFCFLILSASFSYGFDPVTVAYGVQAVSSIYNGMNQADEVADVGFALGDLLEDLGLENDSEEELENAVKRLEQTSELVRDARWASDDLRQVLDEDLKRGQSLSSKIKALRNLLAASKRVAAIMGYRPKAGEKAVRIQEIKINSMILEELQAMRRGQYLAYLENQKHAVNREMFLAEIQGQSRGNFGIRRTRLK